MKKTVSILIPTYHSGCYLNAALDSAISQVGEVAEIVICDNASGDNSWEIIQHYAKRDRRIRAIRNLTNIGPVRNWQRCAQEATSEFACLLFSDDWYEPNFVSRSVPWLDSCDIGFVYSAAHLHLGMTSHRAGDSNSTRVLFRKEAGLIRSRDYLHEILCLPRRTYPLSPGCALFRRNDLVTALQTEIADHYRCGFNAHGAGPDVWTFLLTALRYKYIAHTGEPLVHFKARAGAMSTQSVTRAAYIIAMDEFATRFRPGGVPLDAAKARAFIVLTKLALCEPAARRALAEMALRRRPKIWELIRAVQRRAVSKV